MHGLESQSKAFFPNLPAIKNGAAIVGTRPAAGGERIVLEHAAVFKHFVRFVSLMKHFVSYFRIIMARACSLLIRTGWIDIDKNFISP
jgi:hypothetical protein